MSDARFEEGGEAPLRLVVQDADDLKVISTLLQDWHGITDVCMSVPTLVNARGAGQRLEVPLDDGELARLTASADAIRASARNLGF